MTTIDKEKLFQKIAIAIAPTIVQAGLDLQRKLCDRGSDPKNCTINGKDIPHSYGESVKVWAMAITEEIME